VPAVMAALLFFFLNLLASPFKSKSRLEAENAALRCQLIVLLAFLQMKLFHAAKATP
jgi:hypothetical protein